MSEVVMSLHLQFDVIDTSLKVLLTRQRGSLLFCPQSPNVYGTTRTDRLLRWAHLQMSLS